MHYTTENVTASSEYATLKHAVPGKRVMSVLFSGHRCVETYRSVGSDTSIYTTVVLVAHSDCSTSDTSFNFHVTRFNTLSELMVLFKP